MEARIIYFDKPGKENTDAVMDIVKERAQQLGIQTVVVASYRGYTAEKAVRALHNMKIIVVAGFSTPTPESFEQTFAEGDEELIKSRATILNTTHLFAGITRAMRKKYNSSSPGEIIAQALKMISVGVKVGVEIAVMAADAGLVSIEEDIIAIGGSAKGADTAIVVRPVFSRDLFDIKVKEILCKPRY